MSDFKSFDDFQKELHHLDPEQTVIRESEEIPESGRQIPQTPKLKKKPGKKKARRKWEPYLMGTAVGFLLLAGAVPFLPVPMGDIRLQGNEAVTKEDILFDGDIREPVNVFQISTSQLQERLKKDVRIADAEVSRAFPFYIDVVIAERKPVAVIQEEFGYAFLDQEGMIIQTGDSIRGMDVPVITGVKLDNVLLGDFTQKENVKLALQFLGALSPGGIQVFSEINVGNAESIVAYTRDGIAVRLGDGSSMAERAALAENMVNDVKVRGLSVEYIDASLSSPYIKLKK